MADDDSLSELSSLSSLSPAPSGDDDELELKPDGGILKFFKRVSNDEVADARKSPPPRKREPSPPHENVFADISDIAVSVQSSVALYREKTRPRCAFRVAASAHQLYSSLSCSASDSTV